MAEAQHSSEKIKGVPRRFWAKTRRVATRLPFLDDLIAAYYCVRDPSTPKSVRTVLGVALTYFVVPTDLIPDFIAGLGFADDASVLAIAISKVSGHILPAHKAAAQEKLGELAGDRDLDESESGRDQISKNLRSP